MRVSRGLTQMRVPAGQGGATAMTMAGAAEGGRAGTPDEEAPPSVHEDGLGSGAWAVWVPVASPLELVLGSELTARLERSARRAAFGRQMNGSL